MSAEDFLDTNIFVYMLDDSDDFKRRRAEELVQRSLERGTGCISYQVVQETLNVANKKLGFAADDSRTLMADILAPLWAVYPSTGLYERGLEVRAKYGFGFYDSLIIAGAIQSGCTRLYTEDLQHGQRIQSLTIEDPFSTPQRSMDRRVPNPPLRRLLGIHRAPISVDSVENCPRPLVTGADWRTGPDA